MNGQIYELIDNNETPRDALVISVYLAASDKAMAGSEPPTPRARISWPMQMGPKGVVLADKIESLTADEALSLAEGLRESLCLPRTVIKLQHKGLWREKWGRLLLRPR